MQTYIRIHMHLYICEYIYIYTCIYVYIYIYTKQLHTRKIYIYIYAKLCNKHNFKCVLYQLTLQEATQIHRWSGLPFVCINIYIYIYIYIYTYVYYFKNKKNELPRYVYTNIHIYIYVQFCTCIYIYIYIYCFAIIYTYIHISIYIYMVTPPMNYILSFNTMAIMPCILCFVLCIYAVFLHCLYVLRILSLHCYIKKPYYFIIMFNSRKIHIFSHLLDSFLKDFNLIHIYTLWTCWCI